MARPFRGSAEERARLKAAVDDACARHDRERLGEMGRGASGFREFVRGLPDDIARQREAGLPISFPVSALPADPERRASTVALMGALGVDIVEEQPVSTSAHDLLRVRDCAAPNCTGEAVGGEDFCGEHLAARASNGSPRQAWEWDRESLIAAVHRWYDEHGVAPTSTEWQRRQVGYPSYDRVRNFFPTGWGEMMKAAGFVSENHRWVLPAEMSGSEQALLERVEGVVDPDVTSAAADGESSPSTGDLVRPPRSENAQPKRTSPPMLERIPPALDHAAAAARSSLSPEIRAALADLLNAIAKELRAA